MLPEKPSTLDPSFSVMMEEIRLPSETSSTNNSSSESRESKCIKISQFVPSLSNNNNSDDSGDDSEGGIKKELEEAISLCTVPRLKLRSKSNPIFRKLGKSTISGKGCLLVKVLTCSLSPRDLTALEGKYPFLKPRSMPYTPGTDICGVVVDKDLKVEGFDIGDYVVASMDVTAGGGLCEYAVVESTIASHKPDGVDIFGASGCFNASASVQAVDHYVNRGDRVLVLGGAGRSAGHVAVQLAKNLKGASFVAVASTSSDIADMAREAGADLVLSTSDSQKWWECEDLIDENVDVIIDLAGDEQSYEKSQYVLKSGYRKGWFLAVAAPKDYINSQSTPLQAAKSEISLRLKAPVSGMSPWQPRYKNFSLQKGTKVISRVLQLMDQKKFDIMLHQSSPFELSENGLNDAFLELSRNSNGKIVVEVGSND